MLRAYDMAEKLIDLCIDKAKETDDEKYYADFYKLNKLLYLAQECMYSQNEEKLFDDEIYAKVCGPYIDDLGDIFLRYGNGPIKSKTHNSVSLDNIRENVLKDIVNNYGHYDRAQLGIATKATTPYEKQSGKILDENGVERGALIPIETLKFNSDDKCTIKENLSINSPNTKKNKIDCSIIVEKEGISKYECKGKSMSYSPYRIVASRRNRKLNKRHFDCSTVSR